jgi:hypothetical protein
MRFVLLVGCLSLSACAVLVTVRLRALSRKPPSFPPIYRNNAVSFSDNLRRSSPKILELHDPARCEHDSRLKRRQRWGVEGGLARGR